MIEHTDQDSDPLHTCELRVRAEDPDRFYATLFAPRNRRGGIFAILAFDLELRSIAAKCSTELLAELRFQWWRDVLVQLASGTVRKGHPVLDGLTAAGFDEAVWPALQLLVDGVAADEPRYLAAIAAHCGCSLGDKAVALALNLERARETDDPVTSVAGPVPRPVRPYQTLARLYAAQPLGPGGVSALPPYWLAAVWWRQLTG